MKRMLQSVMAAGALLVLGGAPLAAQAIVGSPIRFGITGGATFPVGNLSDVAKTGWNAGALLDIGLPLVPIGFRVDGTWQQLGNKTVAGEEIKNRIIAGTVDATYTFGSMLPTKFYLIGGVGLYNLKTDVNTGVGSATDKETKFGVNAGAGLRFQLTGFSTFVEARWHDIFTKGSSTQMVPVSVGITF
ncbi:MAG TPA: outer membrane beta-barrel protein [Gemmatimonadaceae bacterium]|nr:outer membrane beta-barrel protein [Gemmatimonadaceae bacterium]